MKPGWKTTEFWLTLLAQVLPILALLGVLSPDDVETLEQSLTAIVTAAGALVAAVAVLIQYIKSRTELKKV